MSHLFFVRLANFLFPALCGAGRLSAVKVRETAARRLFCRRWLVLLLTACSCHAAAGDSLAADCYVRKQSWSETMLATRTRLHECTQPPAPGSFTSDVLKGQDEARQIEVPIEAFDDLWLVTDDGGNGIGCDHSAWGNPELVDSQGKALSLTTFRPVFAKVGWSRLWINQDVERKRIRILGKEFENGFFAHAESRLRFDLRDIEKTTGRDFVLLRTWIGLASTGRGHGSCRFRVLPGLDRGSVIAALWRLVQQDFPRKCEAFSDAVGPGLRQWWLDEHTATVENSAVVRVLDQLKPHDRRLRDRFAELSASEQNSARLERLVFFSECVAARAAVRDAEAAFSLAEKTLDMVEAVVPQPTLRSTFVDLKTEYAETRGQADADARAIAVLLERCRTVRRAAILAHPALDFDTILITQCPPPGYSHMCDQYLGRHRKPGPGLVQIRDWKTAPKTEALLTGKLPPGVAVHPDISYDGTRVLFSYCDTTEPDAKRRRFLIYEYDLTAQSVRRVS